MIRRGAAEERVGQLRARLGWLREHPNLLLLSNPDTVASFRTAIRPVSFDAHKSSGPTGNDRAFAEHKRWAKTQPRTGIFSAADRSLPVELQNAAVLIPPHKALKEWNAYPRRITALVVRSARRERKQNGWRPTDCAFTYVYVTAFSPRFAIAFEVKGQEFAPSAAIRSVTGRCATTHRTKRKVATDNICDCCLGVHGLLTEGRRGTQEHH